jgi:DUF2945 family protein
VEHDGLHGLKLLVWRAPVQVPAADGSTRPVGGARPKSRALDADAPKVVSPAAVAGHPTAMAEFKKGDKVEWNSHGSKAKGEVEKKITSETEAGGRKVKASKDEPQYLVKSEKSGGEAVHKPSALKKR